MKPEIIAPAMNVAAPILPDTEDFEAAKVLSWIDSAPDYKLNSLLFEHWHQAKLPERILYQHDKNVVYEMIENEIKERKLISTHYQQVDGTSFSAPIAASVVAQMIEANPNLTPLAIKNLLVSTARKIPGESSLRQGFGVINAEEAVLKSQNENHGCDDEHFQPPFIRDGKIIFSYHDDDAESVSLVGDFNDWNKEADEFGKDENGIWKATIPCLPGGRYKYKFVINYEEWITDPNNGFRENDGYNGQNSVLVLG